MIFHNPFLKILRETQEAKDNLFDTIAAPLDKITVTCSHEWKEYDSGWTRYNYCTKCDEKDNS